MLLVTEMKNSSSTLLCFHLAVSTAAVLLRQANILLYVWVLYITAVCFLRLSCARQPFQSPLGNIMVKGSDVFFSP